MRRGEVWTAAGGSDYAGKPRSIVIVQDDLFGDTNSVTVCAFTTDPTEAPLFRIEIAPNSTNGLALVSRLMADKVTTMPRSKLGQRIGQLGPSDMARLNQAMMVFLGLAGRAQSPN
jgi:mRNA interferase MazF